mmetsp:Transcript_87634/g.183250  ORF Transcript_87634/g.183250 Transcript_87634/m.183250 type:complete len:256 (+) Transcript_87634:325-1092(+)
MILLIVSEDVSSCPGRVRQHLEHPILELVNFVLVVWHLVLEKGNAPDTLGPFRIRQDDLQVSQEFWFAIRGAGWLVCTSIDCRIIFTKIHLRTFERRKSLTREDCLTIDLVGILERLQGIHPSLFVHRFQVVDGRVANRVLWVLKSPIELRHEPNGGSTLFLVVDVTRRAAQTTWEHGVRPCDGQFGKFSILPFLDVRLLLSLQEAVHGCDQGLDVVVAALPLTRQPSMNVRFVHQRDDLNGIVVVPVLGELTIF